MLLWREKVIKIYSLNINYLNGSCVEKSIFLDATAVFNCRLIILKFFVEKSKKFWECKGIVRFV